jgi:hypothetical protein
LVGKQHTSAITSLLVWTYKIIEGMVVSPTVWPWATWREALLAAAPWLQELPSLSGQIAYSNSTHLQL